MDLPDFDVKELCLEVLRVLARSTPRFLPEFGLTFYAISLLHVLEAIPTLKIGHRTGLASLAACLLLLGVWAPLPQVARLPRNSSRPLLRIPPELILWRQLFLLLFDSKLFGFHYETLPDDQLCPSFDSSALFLQRRSIVELRVSGKQRSHLVYCLLLNVGGRADPLKVRSVHVLMVLNKLPTLIRMRSSQFLPRPFHVVVHRLLFEVSTRGHKFVFLRPLPVFVFFGLKVSMHLPLT